MQASQKQTRTDSSKFSKSKKINKPQRITQLQCMDANSELQLFFIQALNQSFKYLPDLLSKVYNQIQLIVAFAEYRLTIAIDQPHPGDSLQNIRFKGVLTGKIKILYLLLSVILPYLKRKITNYLVKDATGWREKMLQFFYFCDKIYLMLNLINLSIFIYKGDFRSLTQRILKIPMQFITNDSNRVLNFSLMNRKIIWQVYQLFLKTILPYTHDLFGSTLKNIFYLNSYLQIEKGKDLACMFCEEKARMPMKSNCGHLSCYFCYSSSKTDEQKMICHVCQGQVQKWEKLF